MLRKNLIIRNEYISVFFKYVEVLVVFAHFLCMYMSVCMHMCGGHAHTVKDTLQEEILSFHS